MMRRISLCAAAARQETLRPNVLAALIMLLFFAVQDLRSRSISLAAAAVFAFAALVLAFLYPHGDFPSVITALLPGASLGLFSVLTRGGIGSGDAVAVCLLGLCLSFYEVALSLLAGLMLSFLYAVFLLAARRGKNRTAFPFLPFLFAGTLLFLFLSRSF